MIDRHFLQVVKLLRETHHRPESFNLFKVLRSASDEVRLHSRFLSSILDPTSSHGFKDVFLQLFLKQLKIENFIDNGIQVFSEYKNIDILIKNNCDQAIVIENKVYAVDQPQQLYRYYTEMLGEGVKDITLIYLTLHGDEPETQSTEGIPSDFLKSDKYIRLSYENDIDDWIKSSIGVAALEPSLRESFMQYRQLIKQLTGTDQGEQYMEKLKELLLSDDNLLNCYDLKRAFEDTLIDLQLSLWKEMVEYQRKTYPKMGEPDHPKSFLKDKPREVISKFYKGSRNNRYFGLYYSFDVISDGGISGVGIEMEHQLFFGIWCFKGEHPNEHQRLTSLTKEKHGGVTSPHWPSWKYTRDGINFKNPNRDAIGIIGNDEKRQLLAKNLIDDLYEAWLIVNANEDELTND